ncbi:MAG: hypothetical protein JWO59_1287 [Chloroflexi bacterium]|nr:hypothetical protein [Chloroflexota bacterium]
MTVDRNQARMTLLRALDNASYQDPYEYWEPAYLETGLTELQLVDAIRNLSEKGLIEALHSLGDQGLAASRITALGQDFINDLDRYSSDSNLGSLARAGITIHHNTTTIADSTVGIVSSGGSSNTFSGTVTIIHHPQADALRRGFQDFDAALAQAATLDEDEKDEIRQNVQVVCKELAKPPEDQRQEVIERRWRRVESLTVVAAPLLEIASTIGKALLMAHGAG